jgi:Na+/H+-dicarboxylate symporter
LNLGDAIVAALTVDDFPLLFSREHLLPLILFAALFGLAVALLGQRATLVR